MLKEKANSPRHIQGSNGARKLVEVKNSEYPQKAKQQS